LNEVQQGGHVVHSVVVGDQTYPLNFEWPKVRIYLQAPHVSFDYNKDLQDIWPTFITILIGMKGSKQHYMP